MRRAFLILPVLLGAWLAGCTPVTAPTLSRSHASSHPKIVGYFVSWGIYGRNYQVVEIPAAMLTHINYAFAKINPATCTIEAADPWADYQKSFGNEPPDAPYCGNFYQLKMLKEQYPRLKTLISVGGWTLSSGFSTAAATEAGRCAFAASCVEFIRQYCFDGVDLDWEYPVQGGYPPADQSPNDGANFVLLLRELRGQLDAAEAQDGREYLLTVATSAGLSHVADLDLPGMSACLDWFNVMTYDFHGAWETAANHHAPLYANPDDPTPGAASLNVDTALQAYLDGGVPAAKVVMGLPFYGRGWDDVPAGHHGLFQTGAGGSPIGTWEPGVFDYDDLIAHYIAPDESNVFWDHAAGANYLYLAEDQRFISFESVKSCRLKMKYILDKGLGGAMFWELSMDRGEALLGTIYHCLL